MPMPMVSQLNNRLLRYFVKRYTLKRGVIAFGKMLPMGVGAAIGGGGNRMMAKKIISNARKAFGPAPARWPGTLYVLPSSQRISITRSGFPRTGVLLEMVRSGIPLSWSL